MDTAKLLEEYVLGRLDARVLPDIATQLLVDGVDTLAMAQAALPDTVDQRDVRDLFVAALRSAGLTLPTWDQAARSWLKREAHEVVAGERSLVDAARRICETFGWPSDADRLPEPYTAVIIIAGEAVEPWWGEAFHHALLTLDNHAAPSS